MIRLEFIELLKKQDLKELAEKSDTAYTTLTNWEKEKAIPTLDNFERVINAMGYRVVIKQNKEKV